MNRPSSGRRRRRVLSACAAGLVTAACAARADAQIVHNVPRLEGVPVVPLGTGFDSRTGEFREQCVTGTIHYGGSPTGGLQHSETLFSGELTNALNGTLKGGVDVIVFGAEVKETVSGFWSERRYDHKLTRRSWVESKTATLGQPRLTDRGREVLATGDAGYARLVCGDEIVTQIRLGGELFVIADVQLYDEKTRLEFERTETVKVFFIPSTTTTHSVKEGALRAASVRYDAFQIGGDPAALRGVLRSIQQRRCTIDSIAECDAAVRALTTYASSPSGFAGQIANLNYTGPSSPVVGYDTERLDNPYYSATLGLVPAKTAPFDAVGKETLRELRDASFRETAKLDRAKTMLATFHLRAPFRAKVAALETTLAQNVRTLGNAIDACRIAPATCIATGAAALGQIVVVDPKALEKPPTTYDYCRDEAASAAEKATVAALFHAALPARAPATDHAACVALEGALDAAPTLDLSGRGLADIAPLRGVLGLTNLTLRDNRIIDLSPLMELTSLTNLDLANNQIASSGPLYVLSGLERLNLAFNNLRDVRPLQHLSSLREARLYGNAITDFAPVASLPHVTRLVETTAEACEIERGIAASAGLLSQDEAAMMKAAGLAPLYATARAPSSGIEGWYPCDSAAKSY